MDLEAGLKTAKLPQHHSVSWHGMPVIIEWPKGTLREGKDDSGRPWRRQMQADYGYIDDTSAKGDSEPLDIYISDEDPKSGKVFVVEQLKEDGSFDEYKLVAGVPGLERAQELYLAHYPKGWKDDRLGDVYETDLETLREAVEGHQEDGMEGEKKQGGDLGPTGTKSTGFSGGGPATCMDCVHRTPHSTNAAGEHVDSCSHPKVMADPDIPADKKNPDGTVTVDHDDWCWFARKGEEEGHEEPEKPKKASVGSVYLALIGSMKKG